MDQRDVIFQFIDKYNTCQSHQYQIVSWPDEESRQTREIDAYAEAPGAIPLAIEHTRVETFFGQFQDNARFGDQYGQLEVELKHSFDFHLTLSLPVFAFQKGTKWASIKERIRAWLLANASSLPEGWSSHQINGVPFSVGVNKDKNLTSSFIVARHAPSDEEIQIELVLTMASALNSKNDQLSRYRASGERTFLVLESSDISLVNGKAMSN